MSEHAAELAHLRARQEYVQTHKLTFRILSGSEGYNEYIFPPDVPGGSPVARFLQERVPAAVSIEGLLQGMRQQRAGGQLQWVDMGGGHGGAMRELCYRGASDFVTRTCVDILAHDPRTLAPSAIKRCSDAVQGFDITDPHHAPHFIQDDITTMTLERPADLITSVQTLMYLNNPLGAIANWYNQLTPGGMGIVSMGTPWSVLIKREGESGAHTMQHIHETFAAAAIPFAFSDQAGSILPHEVNTLAVEKVEGTYMQAAPVVERVPDGGHYVAARYESATPALQILVDA